MFLTKGPFGIPMVKITWFVRIHNELVNKEVKVTYEMNMAANESNNELFSFSKLL